MRVWRYKRALALLHKVKKLTLEAGIEPTAVQAKTLLPIVEATSLEEANDLQQRWAALFANAAWERG